MEVVLITPSYHPQIGGVERHVKELAENLVKELDVEVYTFDYATKSSLETAVINGVNVKRFRSRRIIYGVEIPHKEFLQALRNCRSNVIIHLHSLHTLLPYFVYKTISRSDIKLVVTTHYHGKGHSILRNLLFKIYKPLLKRSVISADKIICVSQYEKELILRDFSVKEDRVVVIPNGVNLTYSRADNSQVELDPFKILFVGRLEKYKNVDKLIRALSLIDNKRYRLVIVGDGPEKQNLTKLVDTFKLGDRVSLKSNLGNKELVKEYASSGIFVMPSYHEAFSIAAAEALSMGLRVIVANSSALSEFVQAGHAHGISMPVTPEKIAEAIMEVVSNKPKNQYIPYTWDIVTKDLVSVYSSL